MTKQLLFALAALTFSSTALATNYGVVTAVNGTVATVNCFQADASSWGDTFIGTVVVDTTSGQSAHDACRNLMVVPDEPIENEEAHSQERGPSLLP